MIKQRSLTAALILASLVAVSGAPAVAQDLESTSDVARVEAATKHAADWVNGRLKDGDYNMPADRKSTRLNSSHMSESRMPSSA